MAMRLGDILYWVGCGIAVCFALIAFFAVRKGNDRGIVVGVVFSVSALITWIAGRACRYKLSGR